ncbi:hypothetical protein [Corynebacterium amycolatum]|uniref:hypothetical protein n=1 Tax=Corynebacterium amycolatum TaxID=43765 RepID=UPI00396B2188
MTFNNINNSGDGNNFTQHIGSQDIYALNDIDELALEWKLRKQNVVKARNSRFKASALKIGIAIILVIISLLIIGFSGGFASWRAFLNWMADFSINVLASILLFALGLGASRVAIGEFSNQSKAEARNKLGMEYIDDRALDLGFTKRDWKRAKKSVVLPK